MRTDYEADPGLQGWTYQGLDVARQRLAWRMAMLGVDEGRVKRGREVVGRVRKEGGSWTWTPSGSRGKYRLDPANGRLKGRVRLNSARAIGDA